MQYSLKRLLFLNLLGIICYLIAATFSQFLSNTMVFCSATGIAFAFVMMVGFRMWPVILFGTLLAAVQYIFLKGSSPFTLASISFILTTSAGGTITVLWSVWLINRMIPERIPLFSLRGVIVFTLLGAGLSAIISALIGVECRLVAGYISKDEFVANLIKWGVSHFLGVLILAPPIMLWWRDHSIPPRHTRLELLLVTLSLMFVILLVFGPLYQLVGPQIGQPILLMLPLAWSAIRLKLRFTTLFILFTYFFMWWGTASGYGVFQIHGGDATFISSQTFLATLTMTTLLISTLALKNQNRAHELKIDQERMKLALEVANVSVWDKEIATGINHSFLWLQQLGYKEGDIPNTTETWEKLLHPDDAERVLRHNKEYHEGGRKGEYQSEYRLRHKDGSYHWVLTRTNESLFISEPPQRSTGIMVDVTKWKEAEKELRDNLFVLESLARISQIIWTENTFDDCLQKVMDEALSAFHCDRARLLYPCDPHAATWSVPIQSTTPEFPDVNQLREEVSMTPEVASLMETLLVSQDVQLFDADHPTKFSPPKQLSIQSLISMVITPRIGKPWIFGLHQCSHPRIWSDRDKRLFREMGYRITNGLSSLLLLRDLEEQVLKRTEELNERNEELEAFAQTVSHDLRAPLRAMHGFAAALQEDYVEQFDETAIDYTKRIVGAANHMDGLICDLLEYSSLGRIELDPKPINLNPVLKSSLHQLQPEIRQKKAVVEIDPLLPIVLGHKTLLEQIVVNLLSNALKFIEPGNEPRIKIWAERKKTCIILWFEDNGIGVSEEHQEKIFSVFERLHGIERYPGTGIGLAIVRRAAERMKGKVGVISSPRSGSRFWVSLPCPSES